MERGGEEGREGAGMRWEERGGKGREGEKGGSTDGMEGQCCACSCHVTLLSYSDRSAEDLTTWTLLFVSPSRSVPVCMCVCVHTHVQVTRLAELFSPR